MEFYITGRKGYAVLWNIGQECRYTCQMTWRSREGHTRRRPNSSQQKPMCHPTRAEPSSEANKHSSGVTTLSHPPVGPFRGQQPVLRHICSSTYHAPCALIPLHSDPPFNGNDLLVFSELSRRSNKGGGRPGFLPWLGVMSDGHGLGPSSLVPAQLNVREDGNILTLTRWLSL